MGNLDAKHFYAKCAAVKKQPQISRPTSGGAMKSLWESEHTTCSFKHKRLHVPPHPASSARSNSITENHKLFIRKPCSILTYCQKALTVFKILNYK